MKKYVIFLIAPLLINCQNYGKLKVICSLPTALQEVSGTEIIPHSKLLWMINDSGNSPILYGVSTKGIIKKEINIKAQNNDWEDLTTDEKGNVYIADFGNNLNKRKNLAILKINHQDLINKKNVTAERIEFHYPNQTKFPPKKKKLFFDAESFFYWKDSLYIFTKSRVKGTYGKTNLYKIPAKKGIYTATFISTFEHCKNAGCWITSADISSDGKKIALLTPSQVLVFSDFIGTNFFSGKLKHFSLGHTSQKESIVFKDKNTLYITDEKAHSKGGFLYEFTIK